MKDVAEKSNLLKPLQTGKIVEGKVVGKGRSALYLDLGIYGTGIIYGKEYQDAKENLKKLNEGDSVFAKVVDLENDEGYIELSLNQASNELTWDNLKEKKEKGEKLSVKIVGANKGGLLAEVSGIQAFLPVSQLAPEHYPRVEGAESAKILSKLQNFVGKDLEVKIFDLDPRENKLILSERAKESEKIRKILEEYKVGDVIEGEITGITDFGVFMKFGKKEEELEGLIHISELDWQLIENPTDIVKLGDKVKAKIISIVDDKVSLSLKSLKKDPWAGIEEKYKKGDTVKGKVTKFNPYGAFIQIAPKIQGLCHISEFGTKAKMESSLEIGKEYDFKIISLEPAEHRMSLKLATEEK
ncbi:MAG: S1 RNA-binding domain-containing protein [Candidatus Pacebacteria bacterium]|nr:S1 RNA-binding domain-containing protein [Candidatus Paceibacterota bacterium]